MSSFARQALLWASVAALAVPTGMHAQFILSTNDGQISIAGYTGAGGTVTIPSTTNRLPVTSIGSRAFFGCTRLTRVYFKGNAPHVEDDVFSGAREATIYHLPNTTGWGTTFGGRPTAIWKPQTNPERGRRRVRFRKNANPMQKLPRKNCRKAVCL